MDGSSLKFIEALETVGIVEQEAFRDYYELTENLTYEDPIKKVEMLAVPQDEFRVTVMVDYGSEVLGYTTCRNVQYLVSLRKKSRLAVLLCF
jgi:UDP-3-O-[3-hydroxymyristoyl] N-acetylglucosamine deacetylase/3-hydroxyacyl-[acyl-carrier-protein] dehydratase